MEGIDEQLYFSPVTDLADAIRSRRVSSLEVVQVCLRRIAHVNPTLNAVVRVAGDAEDQARRADAELAAGVIRGPLHGVPFTIKDSLETAGIVTTAGTTGWADRVPDRDATVVARLKTAGGILLGKTNTPEFTWSDETDNLVYGRTNNPYDPARSPGGSSGGPAAIVAAGGSPFDIGSDTGNSIRAPSHSCGIAGIKPTSGRVPRTGHAPSFRGILESLTHLGPMARRGDDLALLLPIIAGPDGEDPHVPPATLGEPANVDVGALRVAWFTDNGLHTPTVETADAVSAAARAIASTGAVLTQVVPPGLEHAPALWQELVDSDGKAWLKRLLAAAGTPDRGSFATRPYFDLPARRGDELADLVERIDALRSSLLRWFADFDVIVCPVMPRPAVRHGESYQPWFADTYSEVHNLTGWPAAVVRAGTSPDGLPIGVQLVAPPWREDAAVPGQGLHGPGDRVSGGPPGSAGHLVLVLRRRMTFPVVVDILIGLPFLIDMAGNALDLYDTVEWWDDANHLINWAIHTAAIGILLRMTDLPPVARAGLAVGWAATTAILWELGEYVAFVPNSPEAATAYRDTLGDLALGLVGGSIAAAVTAWWPGRREHPTEGG